MMRHVDLFLLVCCLAVPVECLLIGAWNCQVFGVAKMASPDSAVVPSIVQIINRYDVLLFQEIRDESQLAIFELLNLTRAHAGRDYGLLLSARLGRSTSKEQYAYFYDRALVETTAIPAYEYVDLLDLFERPPYIVELRDKSLGEKFVLVGAHLKPDDAVKEMSALVTVYDGVRDDFDANVPFVLLGDFNADCQYVAKSAWDQVGLWTDQRFRWWIATGTDTTTKSSTCAYDRLVTVLKSNTTTISRPAVFNYQTTLRLSQATAEAVSDHFPVELHLGLPEAAPPKGGLSGGAVAGIVLGMLIFGALMVLLGIFLYRNRFNDPTKSYYHSDARYESLTE